MRLFRFPSFQFFLAFAIFFASCAFSNLATASGSSPKLPNAGFMSFGIWDEKTGERFDMAVWYPTSRAMRDIHLEGWDILAGKDGAPSPGLYPVILLSHDAGASRLASHDIAAHLARNGFIIIAPTHPGDNGNTTNDFFRASNFVERPKHLLRALERAVSVGALAKVMDRNRIGVLGIGAGAATALQLAGAMPDLSRLTNYCPEDISLDPLCSQWAQTYHPGMQADFAELYSLNPSLFIPSIPKASSVIASPAKLEGKTPDEFRNIADPPGQTQRSENPQSPRDAKAQAAESDTFVGPVEGSPENLAAKQDVLAVGLVTPGLIGLFPDISIHGITAHVGIIASAEDTIYSSFKTTERLQELLPRRPASRILPGVNFFDLQAPCPPVFLDTFPAICGTQTDNAPETRKIRNDFLTRFFQKTLGPPAQPPLVLPTP